MKRRIKSMLILGASLSLIISGCSPKLKTNNALLTESVQASNNFNKVVDKNDPSFNEQWFIFHTESHKAWDILNQKKEIKVAVVDTGVDYNHPDLKNKVLKELGYNFLNDSKDAMDDNWHGTHVAGIIAAEGGNNIGIIGVAGFADVKIIPIKVMDNNGEGSSDIIAKGIRYGADVGADVINFSVGFNVKDEFIAEAIKYARAKGVFVVVSSGNDNINCDNNSPAGDEGAYTVSSINIYNERSIFSNYGHSVKVAAPGEGILSTIPGGRYEYRNGTSMAAPIASGIAAMIKAENPNLNPEQIEYILNKTAQDVMEKGKDESTGYGVVNAFEAVKMTKNFDGNSNLMNVVLEIRNLAANRYYGLCHNSEFF